LEYFNESQLEAIALLLESTRKIADEEAEDMAYCVQLMEEADAVGDEETISFDELLTDLGMTHGDLQI
jgi:hypothetical protein